MTTQETSRRCGSIAIVGRPNVGKSTLLNRILGQKISITSRKPQTTRYQILGIKSTDSTQLIFVDTPGWQRKPTAYVNRLMNRQVTSALQEIDLVVMVSEAAHWTDDDDIVADLIAEYDCPRILVLNKHDKLAQKKHLLPLIDRLRETARFEELVPICARTGDNVPVLEELLRARVPAREFIFPDDQITDRTVQFLASEIIREKLIRALGEELPYSISVIIDKFEETDRRADIDATIWVERAGQKGIVIGNQGHRLKSIGMSARHNIEEMLQKQVMLTTWVKVKGKWTNDPSALKALDLS
jgi:GTP-binding protein Era